MRCEAVGELLLHDRQGLRENAREVGEALPLEILVVTEKLVADRLEGGSAAIGIRRAGRFQVSTLASLQYTTVACDDSVHNNIEVGILVLDVDRGGGWQWTTPARRDAGVLPFRSANLRCRASSQQQRQRKEEGKEKLLCSLR